MIDGKKRSSAGRPKRGRRIGAAVLLMAGAIGAGVSQLAAPAARASSSSSSPGPWEASANAAVIGVAPSTGGISLTTYLGQATTAYVQSESQASSAFLNLGGLGYVLGASPVCPGLLPPYPVSKQPQALAADSANGSSNKTSQAQLYPGSNTPPGVGTEHVEVTTDPVYAFAKTYPFSQTVPGVLDVSGWATSTVRYVADAGQQADSSVVENISLLGGKIVLEGLKWSASQHAGSTTQSKGTFSYGSITISGVPGVPITIPGNVPIDTALKTVNAVLAVVGMTVNAPKESIDPGTGGVSIGALQLHFSGSATDNLLVGPAFGPLTDLINLFNGQTGTGLDCTQIKNFLGQVARPTETVLQVLLGGVAGSGAVDVYLGGATADTIAAPSFGDPFAFSPPGAASAQPPAAATANPAGSAPASLPSVLGASASAAPAAAPGVPAQPVALAGSTKCVTTSPAGSGGCWRGLGTWAGGAAVVLGGLLLYADMRKSRRIRPREPAGADT
ncbi:MAG: hypothetical protein JO148_16810 [Acidimicrobiia bacterium]|nr:hypothetical protein [Acidimicrobiia bacterium]